MGIRTSSTMRIAASLFMALAVFAPTCLGLECRSGLNGLVKKKCPTGNFVCLKTSEWQGPEDSKSELVNSYACAPTNWKVVALMEIEEALGKNPKCNSDRYCLKCEVPNDKDEIVQMKLCECDGDDCHDN